MTELPPSESFAAIDLSEHAADLSDLSLCYADNQNTSATQCLLFIHGIGDSKEDTIDVFDHPDAKKYRILAVDLLGFGKSSKPEAFDYDLSVHAASLEQLIDQIKPSKLHIVAHSVGGAVGVLLAERIKDQLASFINVEGNLIDADCGRVTRKTIATSFDEYLVTEYRARLERMRKSGRNPYPHKAMLPLAFYRTAQSVVAWSDSNELIVKFHNLPCPKAYIYGDENDNYPVLEQLDDVLLIKIANCGHRPMDDNPGEFFDRIFEFLAAAHIEYDLQREQK